MNDMNGLRHDDDAGRQDRRACSRCWRWPAARSPRRRRTSIQSITGSQQGGAEVRAHRAERAAGGGAARLRGADAAAHRARPAGRRQCARPLQRRDQPGQRCARSTSPSRASARASCSTSRRRRTIEPQLDGKTLVLVIESAASAAAAVASGMPRRRRRQRRDRGAASRRERAFAEPNASPLALRDIDFRRGAGRRRPGGGRAAEQPGRRRHPPAGPDAGGRLPALDAARAAAPPPRRDRFRHAGVDHHRRCRTATACA